MGLKQGTYPRYEQVRLHLDEGDIFVSIFKDEEVHKNFQLCWKLIDELLFVLDAVSELIADALLYLLVNVHWKAILQVELVQGLNLTLVLNLLLVIAGQDRRKRTICE